MKKDTLKWLLEIADRKPLLFSIALLLIALGVLATQIKDRDNKLDVCNEGYKIVQRNYETRVDSLDAYYKRREIVLNDEVKATLNRIIEDYKSQVDQQQKLNNKVSSTLNRNSKIITENNRKIKSLR
jgi:hypothetical protein